MLVAIIAVVGLLIGVAVDSWVPFGIAAVIAIALQEMTNAFLHDHMHKLYEGEEDDHGVKTIE
jgi:hypothetical protein